MSTDSLLSKLQDLHKILKSSGVLGRILGYKHGVPSLYYSHGYISDMLKGKVIIPDCLYDRILKLHDFIFNK